MTISKKHYNAIANIIKKSRTKQSVSRKLARYFKYENPKFNKEKWVKATGINSKKRTRGVRKRR